MISYAKSCSDLFTRIWMRAKWIFLWMWVIVVLCIPVAEWAVCPGGSRPCRGGSRSRGYFKKISWARNPNLENILVFLMWRICIRSGRDCARHDINVQHCNQITSPETKLQQSACIEALHTEPINHLWHGTSAWTSVWGETELEVALAGVVPGYVGWKQGQQEGRLGCL